MSFFKRIEKKLKAKLKDLSTIEHAMIQREEDDQILLLYVLNSTDGDSMAFQGDERVSEKKYELFNEATSASSQARTGLTRFIIESIKKQ